MSSTESLELICSRSLWQVQWCILVAMHFSSKDHAMIGDKGVVHR